MVDMQQLGVQYEELQDLLADNPDSNLWGLVEMIGDMLDGRA